MAMIKTDPSQTKAVVVLLIILGGAIVATIGRIHPVTQQQASTAATTVAVAQAGPGSVSVVPTFQSSRNPFHKPDAIRAVSDKLSVRGEGAIGAQAGASGPSGSFKLDPMPIGLTSRASDPSTSPRMPGAGPAQATTNAEAAKPQFALLATVGGPNGMCAVIRGGESSTRIVVVGDIFEGGYKVQQIEKNRAVLRNGVDTVVVKRPN